MTLKAVFFDMDGVLFDGREWHQDAFLTALVRVRVDLAVTESYHRKYLDGLSTKQKLATFCDLTPAERDEISDLKQLYTEIFLEDRLKPITHLRKVFDELKRRGLRILCVSNSIYKTVQIVLSKLNILQYFDGVFSNEDAKNPKPSPELYLRACIRENLSPAEVLILEDSHLGRTAAYLSCANVLPIVDSTDTTVERITEVLDGRTPKSPEVNIVIPMAGLGSRFSKVGYTDPKPFIPVFNRPMIRWVIENMMPSATQYGNTLVPAPATPVFHFIIRSEHATRAAVLETICNELGVKWTITTVDQLTEGSACTVLLAKQHINSDTPLVIVNSDQWLDWEVNEFYRALLNPTYDGIISVFKQSDANDIKWSYSKTCDDTPLVCRVDEKKYISEWATTGIYGWRRGSDFIQSAEEMIAKNIRTNNEFYTCPAYNELIGRGGKVRNLECRRLWGLGVPEDLERFLKEFPECHPSLI
jgi:HAD superfamily hydrolase (TIGR01509 family)